MQAPTHELASTDIDKRIEWVKVDKEVNELGLKLPYTMTTEKNRHQ